MCEASRDAVNHEGADVFYHSQVHFEKSTRHFAARAYIMALRHSEGLKLLNAPACSTVSNSSSIPSLMLGLGMAPMDQSEGECLM